MDYPRYRRLGFPVTSVPMESLIKQINFRVKGTEMFWDDPAGAEAILHIRSAALSEDNRLADIYPTAPAANSKDAPPPRLHRLNWSDSCRNQMPGIRNIVTL